MKQKRIDRGASQRSRSLASRLPVIVNPLSVEWATPTFCRTHWFFGIYSILDHVVFFSRPSTLIQSTLSLVRFSFCYKNRNIPWKKNASHDSVSMKNMNFASSGIIWRTNENKQKEEHPPSSNVHPFFLVYLSVNICTSKSSAVSAQPRNPPTTVSYTRIHMK